MNKDSNIVKYLGNYFKYTGKSFDGWVIDKSGISFPILASRCNGNVPKIIIKDDREHVQKL